MSTNFPTTLDTTTVLKNDANDATVTATTHAAQHDNVADALIAIETELGTLPKGTYADVKTRLNDAFFKSPSTAQVIRPSTDVVIQTIRKNTGTDTSNLSEWRDHLNAIFAFIDKDGKFSAQAFKVAGTLLNSTHLSDGKSLRKKDQVEAFSRIQGVSGGLSGDPRTALGVTGVSTFTLNIAAGSALVQGTDDPAQMMYALTYAGGTLVLGTTTGGLTSGQSRIDAICVQYNDSLYTVRSPADTFSFIQVTGTAGTGPNLTNLTGKPATPASAVLLAYIVINFADTGVSAGNVLDQRKVEGPGVWGEDGHRYRIGIDATGVLGLEQVV